MGVKDNLDIYANISVAICTAIISFALCRHYFYSDKRTKRLRPSKSKKKYGKLSDAKSSTDKRDVEEFTNREKEIIAVTENVYTAVGYGLANCIVIQGKKGCILIDTLEGEVGAKEVIEDFEKKKIVTSEKPIKAVIITHFHADHSNGIGYIRRKYPNAMVYGHQKLSAEFDAVLNGRAPGYFYRSVHQFGLMLPDEKCLIKATKRIFTGGSASSEDITPNITVDDVLKIDPLGEVDFEMILYHAPGETNDQIIAWLPKQRVLFPADNIYKAFPNLYAIRGTPARDPLQWMKAIDLMRDLKPLILVPQHFLPAYGEECIMDILTCYRDAIQFTHDQTVRYMNKGYFPDQIAEIIDLPPHLKHHPWLQQTYGTLEWSIKGVFANYMGWFSGRAYDLNPLTNKEEAEELMSIILHGEQKIPKDVLKMAEEALEKDKVKWAIRLCDLLLETESLVDEVKVVKARCLEYMAEEQTSFGGINWYLTSAMELKGELEIKPSPKQIRERIYAMSLLDLFQMLTSMLDAEKAFNVNEEAYFYLTDVNECIKLQIRKGILEVFQLPNASAGSNAEGDDMDISKNCRVKVWTSSNIWRDILCKETSALKANMTGHLSCDPGIRQLGIFMEYFDKK